MIAEILCVGTELLMGQVLNTNAQFLSRRLAALGVSQFHQTVVGDNAERLEAAYRLALSRADVVITSGGLGPTVDDVTKRVAAQVAGKRLVPFPEAEEMVRERFRQYHKPMTENNLSQTMFTSDSTLLKNDHGTAPGAIVPMGGGKVVIHLPGPPMELEPMFVNYVEPYLRARSGHVLVSRYIRIFGMGESMVDEKLRDLENGGNPTLSPYCSLGEVQLRATASAATEAEALALLHPLIAEVRRRLGSVVYAVCDTDGGSLAQTAVEALKARAWTCATCESLTGGLIASTLVEVPGASEVVRGGMVTYQSVAKTMLAGVDAEIIDRCNVVSAEVAMAMAQGARERLDVDIAVSATGLAGPGGGTAERPVGTVFLGVSTRERTYAIPLHLTGSRARIRTLSMKNAIYALYQEAAKELPDPADLMGEEVRLRLTRMTPADPARQFLPAWHFEICMADGTPVGVCDLRLGHNVKTLYGGNIGYEVFPEHRGHRYAAKAVALLLRLAKKQGLEYVSITCQPDNGASDRTCRISGGQDTGVVDLPEDNDMYKEGKRRVRIFRFAL